MAEIPQEWTASASRASCTSSGDLEAEGTVAKTFPLEIAKTFPLEIAKTSPVAIAFPLAKTFPLAIAFPLA